MIKIENLSKSYSDQIVLENISLEFEPGKLTTLLGKNGCGKSTLLRLISGYEFPDSGEATYKEIPLAQIDFPYKYDIRFVHENIDYEFDYSIGEFIDIIKSQTPNWDADIFKKMVKDREIPLDKNYISYSRGQKMQINLMIAIASNAPILLLDEITSVIDVYGRKYFLDLLSEYSKSGKTVIITTNIINELDFYSDNLIIIKDNKIAVNDSVKNIPMNFIKLRKEALIDHEIFSHDKCVWAGVNSDKSVSYIIPKSVANEFDLDQSILDRRASTLEDIFIYFFNQEKSS